MNGTWLRLADKIGLINIISSNDGIQLENLIQYSRHDDLQKIKKQLGQLFMVGAHPYSPADYIEINFDKNGLKINLPVNLNKAVGLSIKEWIVLRRLISDKLENEPLSPDTKIYEEIKSKILTIVPTKDYTDFKDLKSNLQTAILNKNLIKFDYYKQNNSESRTIEPWAVFEHKNQYLTGYCTKNKGIRIFKLDSIFNLQITKLPIENLPENYDKNKHIEEFIQFLTKSKNTSDECKIKISNSAYYHLSNFLNLEILDNSNEDHKIVKTKIIEENWFIHLIKGYGTTIKLLEPDYLIHKLKNDLLNTKIPKLFNHS
jgi:proteasome accessory factor C